MPWTGSSINIRNLKRTSSPTVRAESVSLQGEIAQGTALHPFPMGAHIHPSLRLQEVASLPMVCDRFILHQITCHVSSPWASVRRVALACLPYTLVLARRPDSIPAG